MTSAPTVCTCPIPVPLNFPARQSMMLTLQTFTPRPTEMGQLFPSANPRTLIPQYWCPAFWAALCFTNICPHSASLLALANVHQCYPQPASTAASVCFAKPPRTCQLNRTLQVHMPSSAPPPGLTAAMPHWHAVSAALHTWIKWTSIHTSIHRAQVALLDTMTPPKVLPHSRLAFLGHVVCARVLVNPLFGSRENVPSTCPTHIPTHNQRLFGHQVLKNESSSSSSVVASKASICTFTTAVLVRKRPRGYVMERTERYHPLACPSN